MSSEMESPQRCAAERSYREEISILKKQLDREKKKYDSLLYANKINANVPMRQMRCIQEFVLSAAEKYPSLKIMAGYASFEEVKKILSKYTKPLSQ